jgi:hypothetical protein
VTAFGQTYRIVAQRSNMFGANYAEILMSPDGSIIEQKSGRDVQTDCWYNGRVIGDANSMVTLSTCSHESAQPHASASSSFKVNSFNGNGGIGDALHLNGFVSAFGKQVFIESASAHVDRLQSYEPGQHIAYRPQDMKRQDSACGITHEESHARIQAHNRFQAPKPTSKRVYPTPSITDTSSAAPTPLSAAAPHAHDNNNGADDIAADAPAAAQGTIGRKLLTTYNGNYQKYVELLVINDYKRYQQRGSDTPSLSKSIANQVYTLYQNSWAKLFKYGINVRLVAMITMSQGDGWAPPNPSDATEVDHVDLLSKFSRFVYLNQSRLPAHDEAALYSGYDFTGGTVGYAGIGVMCATQVSYISTSIVQANLNNNNPLLTGQTASHEMVHSPYSIASHNNNNATY